MTLKEVIDAVCDAVNIDRLDSIYGNNDASANGMRALAQAAGDELARRADWQRLIASSSISGAGAALPSDFLRVVPGGALRTSAGLPVRPVTNSAQWAVIAAASPAQPFYFISGGALNIAPPSAGVNAVFDYISCNWVLANSGTRKAQLSADDDGFLLPDRLMVKNIIWRWRRQKGLAYDDYLAEFEADLLQEITADRGVT
ncbi:phage adaptor protein [Oryzifoliimicrobium ureilyticus]|uniref:phage adaptor protein n=1 Tax=Oryzifoliimicrobium ureilyticus TaxID=3113724 RepID=UPI0030764BF1